MEELTGLWWQFYYWAAAQPLFLQVALGIVIVVFGLPLLGGLLVIVGVALSGILSEVAEGVRELPSAGRRIRRRHVIIFASILAAILLFVALIVFLETAYM